MNRVQYILLFFLPVLLSVAGTYSEDLKSMSEEFKTHYAKIEEMKETIEATLLTLPDEPSVFSLQGKDYVNRRIKSLSNTMTSWKKDTKSALSVAKHWVNGQIMYQAQGRSDSVSKLQNLAARGKKIEASAQNIMGQIQKIHNWLIHMQALKPLGTSVALSHQALKEAYV